MKALNLGNFSFVLVSVIGMGSIAISPAFAQSATVSNISEDVLSCMKKNTRSALGWVTYDGSTNGQIKVYATGVGQVGQVSYSLDANQAALNLTYVRGPATFSQIQGGLSETANKCKSGEYQ
ncbi:MAG: hypothetical protein HY785_08070 [Oscillatoriophycideae cyanobacterium NC_groundwater_1537_Pr4_S-0.65um_50_18]|nr:hypothetical protein [Oscillatoriophycideae cyanobacterium NC_groundwater_1537_Pr4_S-0.65um_50_18]